jgi:hypothetical protein
MNDIPPIQDPKNNYCLSYEGKEKADVLNKYFCSITRSLFLCKWLKMFLNTIFSNILLTQDNNETGL